MLLSPSRQTNTRNGGLLGVAMNGGGLLSGAMPPRPMPAPMPAPAPAIPKRERVSPWRIFDRVLGGQTITEGLDAERARLDTEAQRPALLQRQARIQSFVDTLPPEMQLAFAANPEKLGEAFASRAEGRVLDKGDVYMSGELPTYAAPFDAAPGSSVYDPLRPGQPLAVAQQENKVAGGALVSPDGRVLYRGPEVEGVAATADAFYTPEIAQGQGGGAPTVARQARPDTVTVSDGAEVYDPATGQVLARNAPDGPPVDPMAAQNAAQARTQMADNLQTGLTGSRQFVESAGVWTHLMPWQRQNRANLEGHLETIKGNISFEKLMEMKANSPNGASGLGALSDREARMLANTVGALDADMSPEQLQTSFATIDALVAKMRTEQPTPGGGTISPEAARAELRRRGVIR